MHAPQNQQHNTLAGTLGQLNSRLEGISTANLHRLTEVNRDMRKWDGFQFVLRHEKESLFSLASRHRLSRFQTMRF